MDGAGNDFVITDLREGGRMTAEAAQYLGDRDGPFGCDQIIVLEERRERPFMSIWNADGTAAGACGNAARCVAKILFGEEGGEALAFGSPSGDLRASLQDSLVEVDMGSPRVDWDEIPLAEPCDDTSSLPFDPALRARFGLPSPAGASMGNPHATFFVDDAESALLESFGPEIESHPFFPDRVNVSAASVKDGVIRLRTYERGVGITAACGTAACAALVNAHRLGLTGREADVVADGGRLRIRWDEETGHVLMAGPTCLHREGRF
ncbi:diaminopimelate epimerase [Parvularcula sp. ZS-1/3]|uniref:Diaminopimelate epimerase n=2 Tax=Parvularcula mediterranea TaxID=2732508 RepID=A0A7Y3W4W5_9PROT|nr:diaminopimelate epimerase [Parvularcula mediterranea]